MRALGLHDFGVCCVWHVVSGDPCVFALKASLDCFRRMPSRHFLLPLALLLVGCWTCLQGDFLDVVLCPLRPVDLAVTVCVSRGDVASGGRTPSPSRFPSRSALPLVLFSRLLSFSASCLGLCLLRWRLPAHPRPSWAAFPVRGMGAHQLLSVPGGVYLPPGFPVGQTQPWAPPPHSGRSPASCP